MTSQFLVAVLPVAGLQTGKHEAVLGVISIVGCVISIAGLFLTILVYIAIWKYVRAKRVWIVCCCCMSDK